VPDGVENLIAILDQAEALLITAGAGMGVDSGLPDFRGTEGFWKAYPPYRDLGYEFVQMACPDRFVDEPEIGWGFYGHRTNLYRRTEPHPGFGKLLEFANSLPCGGFVFTSNVDGHFQRAGFSQQQVVECHGSILHWQCMAGCQGRIWSAPQDREILIDEKTMCAVRPLPQCEDCGALARPNVLMFGDWSWNAARTSAQESRYGEWLAERRGARLVVLEFGAGQAVPTVRMESERVVANFSKAKLVRVNPREAEIPVNVAEKGISLEMGALEAIEMMLPG
jgi:NAD-dependent SIR2 family protein deacetylase